jgi:hypothetical protein
VLSSESWRSDASFIGLSTGIDYFDDNNEIWLGLFSFSFFSFLLSFLRMMACICLALGVEYLSIQQFDHSFYSSFLFSA